MGRTSPNANANWQHSCADCRLLGTVEGLGWHHQDRGGLPGDTEEGRADYGRITTKQNTFTRVSNQKKVPKSAKNEILGALSTNRHPLFSGFNKLSGNFFWDHRGRIPMGYDSPRAPPAAPPAGGGARPDAAHTRPAWAGDVWKPNRFNT